MSGSMRAGIRMSLGDTAFDTVDTGVRGNLHKFWDEFLSSDNAGDWVWDIEWSLHTGLYNGD